MIRINLLPHREAKRKQKQAAFYALLGAGAVAGVAIVLAVGGYNASRISIQNQRNLVLTNANADLDKKIKEIANLKQEIEALQEREQAVEDLQGDRNQPVYLLDELVKQVPDGVYLKTIKQDGQKVLMDGYAQSQERVAELMRNLTSNSPWLEKPDLSEIRTVPLAGSKTGRKVNEFVLSVTIKRAQKSADAAKGAKGAKGNEAAPAKAAS